MAELEQIEDQLDLAARAIAEPRRRQILALVRDAELSAGEIAAEFDVSRPAISQHLDGAARGRAAERAPPGHAAASTGRGRRGSPAYATSWTGFWTDRLERLKLAAELEQQRRNKRGKRRDGGRGRGRGSDRRKP